MGNLLQNKNHVKYQYTRFYRFFSVSFLTKMIFKLRNVTCFLTSYSFSITTIPVEPWLRQKYNYFIWKKKTYSHSYFNLQQKKMDLGKHLHAHHLQGQLKTNPGCWCGKWWSGKQFLFLNFNLVICICIYPKMFHFGSHKPARFIIIINWLSISPQLQTDKTACST